MRLYRWLLFVVVPCVFVVWSPRRAEAYPWMIKHEYNNCAACHADPSGGGLLSPYGRAQSAILLSSNYGHEVEDPGKFPNFLFGAVPLPDDPETGALNLGAFFRDAYYWQKQANQPVTQRTLYMQADLDGHFQYKTFHAYASVGYAPYVASAYSNLANVTHHVPSSPPDQAETKTPGKAITPGNLVSRTYWLGLDLADQAVLLRVGRMNLPFGLRNVEHTSFVRQITRTDYDQSQQVGVAIAYNSEQFRAEVMGIAGNFQLNPDEYRERGYSGYIEYNILPHYAVGVSSLVTYAKADLYGPPVNVVRQAHGLFTRLSPARPVSVLGEVDFVDKAPRNLDSVSGVVAFLQPDVEVVQGVHVMATGELATGKVLGPTTTYATWLGAAWFVYSHFDLRFDIIRYMPQNQSASMNYLLQAHVYL